MPKALINKIAASERAAGKSPKKAESIAYGAANNRGWMHGSKETAKGVEAEAKFVKDHGTGGTHPHKNLGGYLHPAKGKKR